MPTDLIPDNTASLYSGVTGQPPAPGGAMAGVNSGLQAMSGMLSLKSAQMELQARSAMGPLAQASVDPHTGQMDYNKFGMLIASDPRTAWKAPDILNSLVTRQLTQAQTLKATLESGLESQKLIGNQLTGLLQKGALVTKDDVAQSIAELRGSASGQAIFPSDTAAFKFLQNLPPGGAPLNNWIKSAVLRAGAASNSLDSTMKLVYGDASLVNTGGGQQPMRNQFGTITPAGPAIPNTATPEQRNALVSKVDPVTGQTTEIPRSQAAPMVNGAGTPDTSAGTPGAAPPSAAGTPGAAGPSPGSPPPPLVTKLSPAQEDLVKTTWAGADKYMENLDKTNSAAINVKALASQAEQALQHITTGGGGNVRAEIGSMLQAMQSAGVPGITQSDIEAVANGGLGASQVFKKVMMQLSTQLMTESLRGGGRFTNLEYSNFQQANPNLDTDPKAVKDMLGFVSKMADLSISEQNHFNKYINEAQDPSVRPPARANSRYSLPGWHSLWNNYLVTSGVLKAKSDE